MAHRFSSNDVMKQLHDFQCATVEHAFHRLYLDDDSSRRFLVADETGLGKTHVARGIIAKTIEHLQDDDSVRRIDIVYVCSNIDIADQNLRKLTVTGTHRATPATRLTMLVGQPELFKPLSDETTKPVTFVSFTPATSFDFGWQTGKAEERAILYLLLRDIWDHRKVQDTALRRILQGSVNTLDNFNWYIESKVKERTGRDGLMQWEENIHQLFLDTFKQSNLCGDVEGLIAEVTGKSGLAIEQKKQARKLTADMRQMLARCSVRALEPDLIILDEFQRFNDLLTTGDGCSDAAELANHLFQQDTARVLLLSATPYKPYTLANEAENGEDHYRDFFKTLNFLDAGNGRIEVIRESLAEFRRAILAGKGIGDIRETLENHLTKLLCRTERPLTESNGTGTITIIKSSAAMAHDLAGYVALHRLAEAVEAPLSVEYWKSAPYFANFLDGYRMGERLKDALKDEVRFHDLLPMLRSTQRIRRRDVSRLKKLDWGNARLRQLAEDTVETGIWKLLWLPPSMPYHKSAGVYKEFSGRSLTKRLIFSSWVAAPSAIASLLSYEAERSIAKSANRHEDWQHKRRSFRPRLQYRLEDGRPASMTTLMLFWPNPSLAEITDPLDAARETPDCQLSIIELDAWARNRLAAHADPDLPESSGSVATPWYWAKAIGYARESVASEAIFRADDSDLVAPFITETKSPEENESGELSKGLLEHIQTAQLLLSGEYADLPKEKPKGLNMMLARVGLVAPGNVAWRSLKRFAGQNVTHLGLWQAAAVLANGFRSLFNRPESTLLLDGMYASDDGSYWKAVLNYCRDGNLQAVLDEYLHHVAEADGISTESDEGIMALALAGKRALSIRAARYVATDLDSPEGEGISFHSRFALRFGSVRQDQDDMRLPEVRAAFNSPFWPFILASTSIGQEGVDFHWWCHAVVHWNLPSNPVDFEQREGRVSRYKGHSIRKNVADSFRSQAFRSGATDIWKSVFEIAKSADRQGVGDLVPYWIYPGPAKVERHILEFDFSRDANQWQRLRESLVLYKLAYGQPRQEDLVELLSRRGIIADAADIETYRIRLHPGKQ